MIKNNYTDLLKQMETLDFPLLVDAEKKLHIIEMKRDEVNLIVNEIQRNIAGKCFSEIEMNKLWNSANIIVQKEFCTLPEKLRINAFYFQELMYKYVELIIENSGKVE